MPELLFTIGPPRSGKSTYCTNWAKEAPNRAIVCADSIREALGFEFRQENETLIQGMKDTMIRALLNRGQDVIVDGTHSTKPSIKRIFSINREAIPVWIPSYGIYLAEHNETPGFYKFVEELGRRAMQTKGNYIVPVINRILNNITDLMHLGPELEKLRNVY